MSRTRASRKPNSPRWFRKHTNKSVLIPTPRAATLMSSLRLWALEQRALAIHQFDCRQREPLVSNACGSNCGGGNCVLPHRPFISLAGTTLGSHLDTDCHAIDLGRGAADLRAAFRWNGDWGCCWGAYRYLVLRKRLGIRGSDFLDRADLRSFAHREKRIPLCQHHVGDCNASDAIRQRVANRD